MMLSVNASGVSLQGRATFVRNMPLLHCDTELQHYSSKFDKDQFMHQHEEM